MKFKKIIDLCKKSETMYLYNTEDGTQWISDGYSMFPINGMTELYERTTPSGKTYLAVKKGLLLRGIILPIKIVSEKFVNELEHISMLCRAEYENRMSEGGKSSD